MSNLPGDPRDWHYAGMLPTGFEFFYRNNTAGGRTYVSAENGQMLFDTCCTSTDELMVAIAHEINKAQGERQEAEEEWGRPWPAKEVKELLGEAVRVAEEVHPGIMYHPYFHSLRSMAKSARWWRDWKASKEKILPPEIRLGG